jgi:hypothetical protein
MKSLMGLFLVSCCFACSGCGRGRGKLDGHVFLVTQDGQNVKLGLVDVRVLPYEETKNSIAKTKAHADEEVAKLQPQMEAARKTVASAKANVKAMKTKSDSNRSRQAMDQYAAALRTEISALSELAPLQESAMSWNSGAKYFANLPAPVSSVKTDADGKFSILLDRTAKIVLAATATRRLGDKTETYYWLVAVSLDGQPNKRIFLSNDNLATSDSRDSVVHVVE